MISQGWKNQRRPEEGAPLKIKRVSTGPAGRGAFLDSMLGEGSSRTVESAVSRFRREPEGTPIVAVKRMQVVGSGVTPGPEIKPKGYLRLALAVIALGLVAARFKPWRAAESIRLPELARAAEAARPAEPESKAPVADAGGAAVALWRSESGQWYGVNSSAELSRLAESDALAKLNLPRVEGSVSAGEEHRGKRCLTLAVDPAQLTELLPLRPELAADVDSVIIQGRNIRLKVRGGTFAELGESGFRQKQERLAAVLADLGARKKRAGTVDLRYDNTAVVRLASR